MKARIENGVITVFEEIPNVWGNHLNFNQANLSLLQSEGFFDLIEPSYQQKLQQLGEIYFDEVNKVFIYSVVDIEYDLDELLKNRLDEFDQFQKTFRREITELYLEEIALGILPEEVKQLIVVLRQRRDEIIAELQSFRDTENLERLLNYSFHTQETEQFKIMLKSLKE